MQYKLSIWTPGRRLGVDAKGASEKKSCWDVCYGSLLFCIPFFMQTGSQVSVASGVWHPRYCTGPSLLLLRGHLNSDDLPPLCFRQARAPRNLNASSTRQTLASAVLYRFFCYELFFPEEVWARSSETGPKTWGHCLAFCVLEHCSLFVP